MRDGRWPVGPLLAKRGRRYQRAVLGLLSMLSRAAFCSPLNHSTVLTLLSMGANASEGVGMEGVRASTFGGALKS